MATLARVSNGVFVETQVQSIPAPMSGIAKVGLRDNMTALVTDTAGVLDDAIKAAVLYSVTTFLDALEPLKTKPSEVEISFSLKAAAELGNVIVTKISADANYGVKIKFVFNKDSTQTASG